MSVTTPRNRASLPPLSRLMLCALLSMAVLSVHAQQSNEDDKVYKAEDFGFNALEIGQRRFFRGDKVPYAVGKGLTDHLSIGIGGRFDHIRPQTEVPFLTATGGNLYVEKEIGRLHSLQLGVSWASYEKNPSKYAMNQTHYELAHYFNWTRFFLGYNPDRPLSMATSVRAGIFNATYASEESRGMTAALGFRASLMLNPSFYLHAEPYLAVASDKIDFSGTNNFHRYDASYGVTASLTYLFDGHKQVTLLPEETYRRFFIDYSMGPIFKLNSQLLPFQTMGPTMGLGIGYWADRHFGMRLKGNMSKNVWRELHYAADIEQGHPAYVKQFANLLANGQIDLMINLTSYFAKTKEFPVSVNLLAGYQLGWIVKHDVDSTDIDFPDGEKRETLLSCNNGGLTFGAQLHWQYSDELAFYIEPRILFGNYKIPYLPPYSDISERFTDSYLSLSFGAEMGIAPRHTRKQTSQQDIQSRGKLTIGAGGGPGVSIYNKNYKGEQMSEYTVGGHIAYAVDKFSTVRLGIDVTRTANDDIFRYSETLEGKAYEFEGLWHCGYKHLNITPEYQCNLSTLLYGHDDSRRMSMTAGVAPVISCLLDEKASIDSGELLFGEVTPTRVNKSGLPSYCVGAQASMMLKYDITRHFGIYVEERARIYSNKIISEPCVGKTMKILQTQIGLTYTR